MMRRTAASWRLGRRAYLSASNASRKDPPCCGGCDIDGKARDAEGNPRKWCGCRCRLCAVR